MRSDPRFKQYNRKYRGEIKAAAPDPFEELHACIIHAYRDGHLIKRWSREQIEDAVYTSPTAEEWQRFRVGLKACDTRVKLLRLHEMRDNTSEILHGEEECLRRECRIDNYIGALMRGGFLSNDGLYRVLK